MRILLLRVCVCEFNPVSVYDAETDEDEPETTKPPSELADFFHGKHFYVDKHEFDDNTYHDIRRVIYAYDGLLEKQVTPEVKYMITNRLWNDHFDKVRILTFSLHPNLNK